jgi:hypothetical protein
MAVIPFPFHDISSQRSSILVSDDGVLNIATLSMANFFAIQVNNPVAGYHTAGDVSKV